MRVSDGGNELPIDIVVFVPTSAGARETLEPSQRGENPYE